MVSPWVEARILAAKADCDSEERCVAHRAIGKICLQEADGRLKVRLRTALFMTIIEGDSPQWC